MSDEYWALYESDCLNLVMVHKSEIALKEYAVEITGVPWALCKIHFKIVRVRVEQIGE